MYLLSEQTTPTSLAWLQPVVTPYPSLLQQVRENSKPVQFTLFNHIGPITEQYQHIYCDYWNEYKLTKTYKVFTIKSIQYTQEDINIHYIMCIQTN